MMDKRISREKLVELYHIEMQFFDDLEEYGLLKTQTENNIKYLLFEDLPVFEKLTNWHYDLDVNLPGLEVLQHLMQKMEALQAENRRLRKHFLSSLGETEDIEDFLSDN